MKGHYETKGLLTVVDAGLPMCEVTEEILVAPGRPERPESYVGSGKG